MSLINDLKVPCVMLDKKRTPDGEGGFLTEWAESARFEAAISFDTSIEARRAEKNGVTSVYTVTTDKTLKLEYHDVFRRLYDGKIFRVTSDGDDLQTPNFSAIPQSLWVTAEEWSLTS